MANTNEAVRLTITSAMGRTQVTTTQAKANALITDMCDFQEAGGLAPGRLIITVGPLRPQAGR